MVNVEQTKHSKIIPEAMEVAQKIKCSAHKHTDWSLHPQNPRKSWVGMAADCNPSAGETGKGSLWQDADQEATIREVRVQ